MSTTRRPVLATSALLLGLVLTGCGNIAENVAERAVEEAAEAANGGGEVDLEIDEEGGAISITSSEGSFSVGGDQELPQDFPDDLPLPADSQVLSSMSFSDGADRSVNVSMTVVGDAASVADQLQADLEQGGYTIAGTSQMELDGLATRMLEFEGNGLDGFITVAETDEGTVANYTVGTNDDGA